MIKNCVIFLFLATAYTVLMAHNFTPHIHHSEQEAHHHEDGKKHHHNDNNQEEDGENTATPFHLLEHSGGPAIVFLPRQITQTEIQERVVVTVNIISTNPGLKFIDKPPILPSFRTRYLLQPQTLPYFFLLKAPPALTA